VRALARAGGDIKLASIILFGVDRDVAEVILARHNGSLRSAMAEIAKTQAGAK
jgi:N-acetylmuramic acid 6-phosphate (MurNAc-6-P) etherase